VTSARLVPVKKNAALAGEPLDLVLALLAAYPRLGKPSFPRNTWRQSLVGDEFTDISQALLTALLASPGPRTLASLGGIAYDMIAARYRLGLLTELQHDHLRASIAADVTIAMSALHVLGVVVLDREAGIAELTGLGQYAIRRVRGMPQPGDPLLRVRITLKDVADPQVWRRVLIPAGYTLDRVHAVIQAAMGWRESHLHAFWIGDREYGAAYPDDEFERLDESRFRFGDLVKAGTGSGTSTTSATAGSTNSSSRRTPKPTLALSTRRAPSARVPARPRTAAARAVSPISRNCSPAPSPERDEMRVGRRGLRPRTLQPGSGQRRRLGNLSHVVRRQRKRGAVS
jgi:hypothetical protein